MNNWIFNYLLSTAWFMRCSSMVCFLSCEIIVAFTGTQPFWVHAQSIVHSCMYCLYCEITFLFNWQNTHETARTIKGMHLRRAVAFLKNVTKKMKCVPYKRYNGGVSAVDMDKTVKYFHHMMVNLTYRCEHYQRFGNPGDGGYEICLDLELWVSGPGSSLGPRRSSRHSR